MEGNLKKKCNPLMQTQYMCVQFILFLGYLHFLIFQFSWEVKQLANVIARKLRLIIPINYVYLLKTTWAD